MVIHVKHHVHSNPSEADPDTEQTAPVSHERKSSHPTHFGKNSFSLLPGRADEIEAIPDNVNNKIHPTV